MYYRILLLFLVVTLNGATLRGEPQSVCIAVDSLLNRAEFLRSAQPDSALRVVHYAMHFVLGKTDSLEVKAFHTAGNCYYSLNRYDSALVCYRQSLRLARDNKLPYWVARNLNRMGNVYQLKSRSSRALSYYKSALKLNETLNDREEVARTLVNIGTVYSLVGSYPEAVRYMLSALETYSALSSSEGVAWTSLSLARLFSRIEMLQKALQYGEQALRFYRRIDNRTGIILAQTNLANIYFRLGHYTLAREMAVKVLKANKVSGNMHAQAANYLLLGIIYFETGRYDSAAVSFSRSLKLKTMLNDSLDLAKLYCYIGKLQVKTGNPSKGLVYLVQALQIAQSNHLLSDLMEIYGSLSDAYQITGRYRKALSYNQLYARIKDSINSGNIARLAMKYEFEKREREQELLVQQREAIQQEKLDRQRAVTLLISVALFLAVVLALVVLHLYSVKKRSNRELLKRNAEIISQKNEIIEQKHEIEAQRDLAEKQRDRIAEQQKQITDSITYAGRIQTAVLPRPESLGRFFDDYFVLYLPKNIVSGDFYWVTNLPDGRLAVAVADCTGHGVPGAFMSMLGITLLKELTALRFVSSGELLDKLRSLVITSLNQRPDRPDSHDGMDLGLLILDFDNASAQFSGAYMPLLLVRKSDKPEPLKQVKAVSDSGFTLYEIKGDKMPVGCHVAGQKPFSTHTFTIEPDDRFYLLSDGYTDQFGGPKNQKLMMVNFKKIILAMQQQSMTEQRQLLLETFTRYRGARKQVDDIIVMGFKFLPFLPD